MASEKLNLYQKIVEVRKSIGGIYKDNTAGKGSKFSYNYVSESQILSKISDEMDNQNLLLIPSITHRETRKEGNQYIVELDLNYKWINGDNPTEILEIPYFTAGQQSDASKALGTALTYGNRYFLLKMFNLATDEDDADAKPQQSQKQKKQPQQQRQDAGKVELVKNNANVLAKILTANDQPMTQQDVISAYLNGGNLKDVSNEALVEISNRIKAKIEDYKKRDQAKEQENK